MFDSFGAGFKHPHPHSHRMRPLLRHRVRHESARDAASSEIVHRSRLDNRYRYLIAATRLSCANETPMARPFGSMVHGRLACQ